MKLIAGLTREEKQFVEQASGHHPADTQTDTSKIVLINMNDSLLIVPSDSRRPSSSFTVLPSNHPDHRGSINFDRRPSLLPITHHKKQTRPKPRLDDETLKAKQDWAAKGIAMIMRRKVAERRRAFMDADSMGNTNSATGVSAIDVEDADEEAVDDKSAMQSMVNGYIISAIPYMPKPLAVLCLIMNLLLPGTGTVVSGVSVLCCGGESRMAAKADHHGTTCCVNLMVGVMQLFTVAFMLVGWAWSLVWGIYMIILADEMQKVNKDKHQKKLQAKALVAMNNKLRAWTMIDSQ